MTSPKPLALAALLALAAGQSFAAEAKTMTLDQLRQARKQAAHRKRRIVFNNDGDETVYSLKHANAQELLDARTAPLLGSQVDSIFYCTWSSGFSFFTHNTKVGQVFDTTANPDHPANTRGGFSRNKTADFIRQGTDPLEIMVGFCKKHDIEIFWSFRMNDTHDAWGSWYGKYLFPQIKKDHPEWLVSRLKDPAKRGSTDPKDYDRSRYGGWTAMDFNHQEVRGLAVAFIEEVCQNYDVDGIEMDFFRHPIYLKEPAWGKDTTPQGLERMTSMVRKVRAVTERIGLQRGRPILVSVRVPDSVGYCKAMGIDIERWLAEGLVDIMAVTGYFRLNHWEVSAAVGHKYGVPVFASLSETRLRDKDAARLRSSLACYRGRAANAWAAGVDAVYMFNAFNPRAPLWRELGDLKTLEPLDKVYVAGTRGVRVVNSWMANGVKRFLKREPLFPERPRLLKPGEPTTVELRVGQAAQSDADVKLRVRVHALRRLDSLSVALNRARLASPKIVSTWLEYAIDPKDMKDDPNELAFTLNAGAAKLTDVWGWRWRPRHLRRAVRLAPGKQRTVKLRLGAAAGKKAKLLAGFDDLADPAQLTATFNGKPLRPTRTLWVWLEYAVDPAQVKQGVNAITFTATDGKPRLQDMALWVRPAKGK